MALMGGHVDPGCLPGIYIIYADSALCAALLQGWRVAGTIPARWISGGSVLTGCMQLLGDLASVDLSG